MRGLRSVAQPLRAAYGFAVANVGAVLGGTRGWLEDNLGALEVEFDQHHQEQLDAASAVDLGFPHEALRRFGYAR